jgi:mono/diheme cytochrome c family protein
MKRFVSAGAALAFIAGLLFLQDRSAAQAPAATTPADPHRAMLDRYCVGCHNSRAKTGGLALDNVNLAAVWNDAPVWEKALRKLRGNLMPPPGFPQPPQETVGEFVSWMETSLDSHASGPKAGRVKIQRLNRAEYAAAVKALVGVEIDPREILPQDISVQGFDNVAAALTVSPAFLEQYVTAARKIAALSVGDPKAPVSSTKFAVAGNQDPELPLPLGTRGGIRMKHNFAADGEYRFSMLDLSAGLYVGTMENESTLVMMLDGAIVFRGNIGGPKDLALANRKGADGRAEIIKRFTNIPVKVQAGVRDVVVAFIDRPHVETPENFAGAASRDSFGYTPARQARLVDGVTVTGPFNPTGITKTASRQLIFVCDPEFVPSPDCAKRIVSNLAHRAYRRPVTDEDLKLLMPFYEKARAKGATFDQGIEKAVAAVLVSPDFLYRSLDGTGPDLALTDLELASRLSFFLWNSGPDDELLKLAEAGQLSRGGTMESQVRRMLGDPRASSLVSNFAMKWLDLDDLDSVVPDPELFQGFSAPLRHDLEKEADLFLRSILLKDRSLLDLLTSDETFLNERLARHYGIDGISGNQFRQVKLTKPERAGLLGKAAVLMRTSYGDRTSPVLRGAWVLDKLLGTPPTPPPPNVETNLTQAKGEKPKTVRARLEQHRDNASCKQCHGVIDPTGLALENFDAIGRWRTTDAQAKEPIDAATVLPNGIAINGPDQLRAQLVRHPETFARAFTEKLMVYAVNRELEYFDMPQVRAVVRGAAKQSYTLSSIVLGIVNTDAFRKQGPVAKQ